MDADKIAERLWAGALRWADRKIKPHFVAAVAECLSEKNGDEDELTADDLERVAAGVARLGNRLRKRVGAGQR